MILRWFLLRRKWTTAVWAIITYSHHNYLVNWTLSNWQLANPFVSVRDAVPLPYSKQLHSWKLWRKCLVIVWDQGDIFHFTGSRETCIRGFEDQGVYIRECNCNTDGCNTAISTQATLLTFMTSLFISIYFLHWYPKIEMKIYQWLH